MGSKYSVDQTPFSISYTPTHLKYNYAPLAGDGTEIRLIRLRHSTAWAEPIMCEILHTKDFDNVDYLALSYTWKGRIGRQDIHVGNKSISCTRNLYSALLHLRQQPEDLILWVDAICIDQNNLDERSQQVRKMRYIYKNASKVLVWLGPSSISSLESLELVSELYKNSHDRVYIEKKIADPECLETFYGLCRLFELDYWRRVWVVQETSSAKDIIVHYGADSLPWKVLVGVQKLLCENYDDQLASIFRKHPAMRGYITWHGPNALRPVYGNTSVELPDLVEMVLKHVSKDASDPRDKIYAFVGISKQSGTQQIDYSSSVRQVYLDFVCHTVLQSESLDIICVLPRRKDNDNRYELPSWVPNWGMKGAYSEEFFIPHIKSLYKVCASGTTKAHARFNLEEGAVFVSGGIFDTVYHVGQPCAMERGDEFAPAAAAIIEWWSLAKSLTGASVLSQEAFVRTLCVSRIGAHHITSDFTKSKLLQWVLGACSTLASKFCPEMDLDETLQFTARLHDWSKYPAQEARAMGWVSQISANILHRRLWVSNSGILGLVPDTITQGDNICILLGCSVPVVLRPVDNHYIFIGTAYVDGYMTGEAIEELEVKELKLV